MMTVDNNEYDTMKKRNYELNLFLRKTGIRATMATANKQVAFVRVNNSSLSDEDNLSNAAPACTCIKEGGATPTLKCEKGLPRMD